jgi:hypothetical protein
MRGFWKNWMLAWCGGAMIFGLVLAGAATPATDGAARMAIALLDGPALDSQAVRFGIGLQGALTIGWAFAILAAVPERAPWRLITLGMIVWYVIDSAISVVTGVALNALSNTLLVAAFLPPVLGSGVLRRD